MRQRDSAWRPIEYASLLPTDFQLELRPKMRIAQVILAALLLTTSVAMTCVAVEVGYRGYQYLTLPGRLAALVAQQNPGGYNPRYRP